jgi:hypothetical protein
MKIKYLFLVPFLCFMAFIPSANAKTYTDKNLEIKYTIPDDWEIVAIGNIQTFMSENNFSQSVIDSVKSEMNDYLREFKCTYLILPNPNTNKDGTFITISRDVGDNSQNITLDDLKKYIEESENTKLAKYTNSKTSYLYTITNNGNIYIDKYFGIVNNNELFFIAYNYHNNTRYLSKDDVENLIDTIEYGIKTTNNNTQSNSQDEDTSNNGGSTSKITVHDSEGNIISEKAITSTSNNKYFTKNMLIKIVGTILSIVFAVIISKERKFSLISFLGWLFIAFQVIRCIFSDALLVTKDRIEILYTAFYFLPGIIGLILLGKANYKILNNYGSSSNTNNQAFDQKSFENK